MTDNSAMGSHNNNKLHQTAGTPDLLAAIELCADLYWLEDADGICIDVRSFRKPGKLRAGCCKNR
jgi:hypothetical protein